MSGEASHQVCLTPNYLFDDLLAGARSGFMTTTKGIWDFLFGTEPQSGAGSLMVGVSEPEAWVEVLGC